MQEVNNPSAKNGIERYSSYVLLWFIELVFVGVILAEEPSVDFSRDVAPILSANCFQCHGPDGDQREADLRFDQRQEAFAKLVDGGHAIVPMDPERSQLIARIKSDDPDLRMPPPDSNYRLTEQQIQTLEKWIELGAPWSKHWAFEPLSYQLPAGDWDWGTTPIDRFILRKLKKQNAKPTHEAVKRNLIRRVYYDLLGLPPSVEDVDVFLANDSPDAYEQLVDRLLASPRYGERWGRHWLDVARYGDSNGGDENHLYPYAFRYRNYVVDAWNRGMAYDEFLRQQLAGDQFYYPGDAKLDAITATGFLSIGMKILAEQDPVKKRADIVDEQVDTFGKAILGLTLGCARCHDHKFDPIPTTDYYALAGIFHSTEIHDGDLETKSYLEAKKKYDEAFAKLESKKQLLEQQIESETKGGKLISRQAEDFQRGNVAVVKEGYGKGIGIISDPGGGDNFAEYDLEQDEPAEYLLQLRYAAENPRPGRILLNNGVVKEPAITEQTGGWFPADQKWFTECRLKLSAGKNTLRFESKPNMSHVDRWRLVPVSASAELSSAFDELETLTNAMAELAKPEAPKAMAVKEGEVTNTRVHKRGSHLSLGDEVPRRFVSVISNGSTPKVAEDSSGRRELVKWLTDSASPASALTSRVMVNRIWKWHFGHALVGTPNNFGLQGERPTHPELLDYLAASLVRKDWSIKQLQREIVLSDTYRQASVRGRSVPYASWQPKRVEAEVFRDSLLFHSRSLDVGFDESPPNVKSQDPSPDDLRKNRETYDSSPRRSIYLTIVRTNVYKLLTLLDFPDSSTPIANRPSTIVPTQALLLMNSPFMMQQSSKVTDLMLSATEKDSLPGLPARRTAWLYTNLFNREPTSAEEKAIARMLRDYLETGSSNREAWTAICQTLLTSHEYFYID